MRQIYGLLVWTVLLGLNLTFNRAHAQYGPGRAQPLPMYEGLRETLKWIHFPQGRSGNTAARPTEIRSRFIATTIERYEGAGFKYYEDSLRLHWHDTTGAGFNYLYYSYGSTPDLLEREIWTTDSLSGLARVGYWSLSLDSSRLFALAPGGNTFLPDPWSRKIQAVNNNNRVDSAKLIENGQVDNRKECVYDASGKWVATRDYLRMGTGTTLTLSYIDSFVYDNNGDLVSLKSVDMYPGPPTVSSIEEITYDANHNITQDDISINIGGSLVLKNRYTFTYNTSGKRITGTTQQANPVTNVLENQFWEGYSYNAANQMTSRDWATWSGTAWDTTRHALYEWGTVTHTPAAAYLMAHTSATGGLDTIGRVKWSFNSQGLCDSLIRYGFTANRQWAPEAKTTIRYNDFDQVTYLDRQSGWASATQSWIYLAGDFRTHLYYETFNTKSSGIKNADASLAFSVYPNPVSSSGELHIRAATAPIKLISVYDLAGRLLVQQQVETGKREVLFSLGQLPAGTYILNVRGDKGSGSKKIVVR